jgi:hypothetical protein
MSSVSNFCVSNFCVSNFCVSNVDCQWNEKQKFRMGGWAGFITCQSLRARTVSV